MRVKSVLLLASAALIGVAGGACGPVEYINQVTRRASAAVAAAKAAGAEKYAPYEYTAAKEYLHKAREEEGYADHQAAIRFGKKAETMAARAKELALEQAGTESITPGEAPIDPAATPAEQP
jgi:hypothetical protein